MQKSVATLRERVQVLRDFLRDYAAGRCCSACESSLSLSAGKVEADHTLLRSVRSICNRLPTMDSSQFSEDFLNVSSLVPFNVLTADTGVQRRTHGHILGFSHKRDKSNESGSGQVQHSTWDDLWPGWPGWPWHDAPRHDDDGYGRHVLIIQGLY